MPVLPASFGIEFHCTVIFEENAGVGVGAVSRWPDC
jgi:hypothetical protein